MDNQNKDRMTITMQKTYQHGTHSPELVKKYSCNLPINGPLEALIFEIYDGLQAMGYDSKDIALAMHERAEEREPELFLEEEETEEEDASMEIKKAFQKSSKSLDGHMGLEELAETLRQMRELPLEEGKTEEETTPKEIKKAYKIWYDRWLDSNSFDDFISLEEFAEKYKNDNGFAEYWKPINTKM